MDDNGASCGPGARPSDQAPSGLDAPRVDPSRAALKVWWTPQVPMDAFEALVPDVATAAAILDVLADYDAFQFENRVKGDYCNAGGLMILRDDGEWEDWEDPATCADFDEWRDENLPRIRTKWLG